jgi:hypothetical protein
MHALVCKNDLEVYVFVLPFTCVIHLIICSLPFPTKDVRLYKHKGLTASK